MHSKANGESPSGVDRMLRAWLAKATFGMSPASTAMAYLDWSTHFAMSPAKQAGLAATAVRSAARLSAYAVRSAADPEAAQPAADPSRNRRFRHPAWQRWPFNLVQQSYLLCGELIEEATTGVHGVTPHHEHMVSFAARQLVEAFSPANVLLSNPEVLQATLEERGSNLARGLRNFVGDQMRMLRGEAPEGAEEYRVGVEVATSPGKVIYRNRLMELIQYSPTTEEVWKEPILIVPAWMMKYYIMDLSPENSLVKYLVDHGFTVFMISWKNPTRDDRDLEMEDYRRLGVMDALDAVTAVVPDTRVHAVGYCLGGIVLTIAAAAMERDGDDRLASVSTFTTLTDFSEPGDMGIFVDPAEVVFVEDMMWEQGYLAHMQAASSFRLLRARELVWAKMVDEYLLGKRQPMFDLMAWNADGTRMPSRMHSQLLRNLFLDNELYRGRYRVGGNPIAIGDIHTPMFTVAAKADHVAPWRSVYAIHLQSDAQTLTFCLTNGGHNVGVVNPPGPRGRGYRLSTSKLGDRYIDPDTWLETTAERDGSWWPAWEEWLRGRSSGKTSPPATGNPEADLHPIAEAPGLYVRGR